MVGLVVVTVERWYLTLDGIFVIIENYKVNYLCGNYSCFLYGHVCDHVLCLFLILLLDKRLAVFVGCFGNKGVLVYIWVWFVMSEAFESYQMNVTPPFGVWPPGAGIKPYITL